MITNGIQEVALAFEKTEPGVRERPPRSPNEPILDSQMFENFPVSGTYIGRIAFGVYCYLHSIDLGE